MILDLQGFRRFTDTGDYSAHLPPRITWGMQRGRNIWHQEYGVQRGHGFSYSLEQVGLLGTYSRPLKLCSDHVGLDERRKQHCFGWKFSKIADFCCWQWAKLFILGEERSKTSSKPFDCFEKGLAIWLFIGGTLRTCFFSLKEWDVWGLELWVDDSTVHKWRRNVGEVKFFYCYHYMSDYVETTSNSK